MDRDWQALCERKARRLVPWSWVLALPQHAVSSTTRDSWRLAQLCEMVRGRDDTLAVGLVWLAQRGDVTAGRIVVQAMLPKLRHMARRDARHDLTDYVSAAWVRIMTFPASTRSTSVLVNLSLDCLKWLTRQTSRHSAEVPMLSLSQPGVEMDGGDAQPPWHIVTGTSAATGAYVDDMLTLAVRDRLLSAACVAVLRSVYCDGLSGREAAERHAISYDMVRYYRSSAVKVLRAKRRELIEALGPC